MIFWLVLKLEISYRILKELFCFRAFFEDYIFCMVKYLSFHNSSFVLGYFLMKMARPQCNRHAPSLLGEK
jgi:hypothetical protein